jgi:hypothetical protein
MSQTEKNNVPGNDTQLPPVRQPPPEDSDDDISLQTIDGVQSPRSNEPIREIQIPQKNDKSTITRKQKNQKKILEKKKKK